MLSQILVNVIFVDVLLNSTLGLSCSLVARYINLWFSEVKIQVLKVSYGASNFN